MLLSMSIQPGAKIYYLDTNDGSLGEVKTSYAKVINTNIGVEIQYRNVDNTSDTNICTEKEISEKIPRDGILYFKNKHVRNAYREKIMKELKK